MNEVVFLTSSHLSAGLPGIALINKPTGVTSHDVVDQVRRITGIKRVGHAGTLDPLATGLLIILVGREFTKRQSEFLKQDKEYECTAQLGVETDSYDSDGQVLKQTPWEKIKRITKDEVDLVLKQFVGESQQQVPVYSAVKVKGQELYKHARNKTADLAALPSRLIKIEQLELLDFQANDQSQIMTMTFRVRCSSGTYIRSLAHDIGQKLGVGAMVTGLKRTKIGDLSLNEAFTLPPILDSPYFGVVDQV